MKTNLVVPALLTSASILPHLSTVSVTVFIHIDSSPTSADMQSASTPNFSHSFATFLASSIELVHVMVTFQPLEARSLAVAAPTPRLPPVITATGFLLILFILIPLSSIYKWSFAIVPLYKPWLIFKGFFNPA